MVEIPKPPVPFNPSSLESFVTSEYGYRMFHLPAGTSVYMYGNPGDNIIRPQNTFAAVLKRDVWVRYEGIQSANDAFSPEDAFPTSALVDLRPLNPGEESILNEFAAQGKQANYLMDANSYCMFTYQEIAELLATTAVSTRVLPLIEPGVQQQWKIGLILPIKDEDIGYFFDEEEDF